MKFLGDLKTHIDKKLFLAVTIVIFGVTLCCGSTTQGSGGLPDRDPDLAVRLVKEEGALLLDVRTPREFLTSKLPGSRNLPIEQLPQRLAEIEQVLEGNKDQPIVVYCAKGGRAARAKQILLEAGYPNVTNLGGISDWTAGK